MEKEKAQAIEAKLRQREQRGQKAARKNKLDSLMWGDVKDCKKTVDEHTKILKMIESGNV